MLFYSHGSCQMEQIKNLLLLNSDLATNYFKHAYMLDGSEFQKIYSCIDDAEVLIFQNFDSDMLPYVKESEIKKNISSEGLLRNVKNKKLIFIPNYACDIYHPASTFYESRAINDTKKRVVGNVWTSIETALYNIYKANREDFKDFYSKALAFLDEGFYSENFLKDNITVTFLKMAYDEENLKISFPHARIIGVKNYIENNYKKNLLFYSHTHASHHVLLYIVNEILNELGLKEIKDLSFEQKMKYKYAQTMPISNSVINFLGIREEVKDLDLENGKCHIRGQSHSFDEYLKKTYYFFYKNNVI